jgi:hypothetical protein
LIFFGHLCIGPGLPFLILGQLESISLISLWSWNENCNISNHIEYEIGLTIRRDSIVSVFCNMSQRVAVGGDGEGNLSKLDAKKTWLSSAQSAGVADINNETGTNEHSHHIISILWAIPLGQPY